MSWTRGLIRTGRRSHIHGGASSLDALGERAREMYAEGRRRFLVTDENVERFWGDRIREVLGAGTEGTIVLEAGEPSKSLAVAGRVYEALAAGGMRRDDVLVALGGGVVGDLGGFVAATYHRGVEFWQVPTSLLAQVDSSVGGKVAINLRAGKNLVGSFYQPDAVYIDPSVLRTLPHEEVVNGMGEIVKYGLLAGEPLFGALERDAGRLLDTSGEVLTPVVRACVEYKADVVERDERESGDRAVLNLGHTTAHAVEVLGGYEGVNHGQAVGVGLLVALAVSEKALGLKPDVRDRTQRLLVEVGLPISLSGCEIDALLEAMRSDKKRSAGGRGFVGLRGLGEPVWGVDVPDEVVRAALAVVA